MTVILTLFGLIVFAISCFTAGFKSAFKRLTTFAITGVIIDVVLVTIGITVTYASLY